MDGKYSQRYSAAGLDLPVLRPQVKKSMMVSRGAKMGQPCDDVKIC